MAQESTLAGLQASVAQSEKKLVSLRSNYQSQLENERVETQTQLAKSAQELEKSSIRSGVLEVRSPTDGVVKDLAVTSKNAVVQAGALLMNIVPQAEALQAEVVVANEDVGFIVAGQAAQVKIAAFPFTKYGLVQGSVTHVGADASDPKQNSSPQAAALTYRALVKLDGQKLAGYGGSNGSAALALNAGIAVVVEIHQGKRLVMGTCCRLCSRCGRRRQGSGERAWAQVQHSASASRHRFLCSSPDEGLTSRPGRRRP